MKRILSFILSLTMIMIFASVVNAEHYSKFTDVKPDSWYYEDVDNAVRLGIINGKSETTFAPDDNLTYAEAIKLAACMYQLYKDGSVYLVSGGNPWYQTYVDYAKDHGIITENFFYKVSKVEILVDEAEFSKRMTYKCIVTDATGFTKTASNMYVAPETTPYLAYQPNTVRANYGEEVSFYARTINIDATYQWYIKNDNTNGWKKIEPTDTWAKGATTSTLKIQVEKADFISHCEYKCEVTQGSYSVSSNVAKLLPKDIVITEQPENASAKHGEKAKFKVVAEGANDPFTYQWLIQTPDNEIPLKITEAFPWAEGYYTDTLSVAVDEKKLTSDYKFSCIVTDKNGVKRISDEAYVIVTSDASVKFEENYSDKSDIIVIMP